MKSKLNWKHIFIAIIILILIILGFSYIIKNVFFNDNETSNIITNANNENTGTAENSESSNTSTIPDKPTPSVTDNLTQEQIELSKKRGLPVLMYHFFYDKEAGESGKDANFIEIHDFEEQIKYLTENNYYVPTWEEVSDYVSEKKGLPEKSIVLTVDDGDESFFRLAVPVLEKYNFTATSFLITSWYESASDKRVSSSIDYQSHSHNMHRAGSDGKGAFLTNSYESSCEDLEQSRSIIGDGCRVFCYPFGHFNDSVKNTLKDCNYILSFTTQYGRLFPGMDAYELPRIRISKGISLNSFISLVK